MPRSEPVWKWSPDVEAGYLDLFPEEGQSLGRVFKTVPAAGGKVLLDLAADGLLLGIEVLP